MAKWTSEQFQEYLKKKIKRKHKYHAEPIFRQDRSWDSTGEYRRYCELQLLEQAGEITDLECQPTIELTRARIKYRPDFVYLEDGRMVWEEFKGVRTPRFNLICRLWRYYGPGLLRITGRRGDKYGIVTKEIMVELKDD